MSVRFPQSLTNHGSRSFSIAVRNDFVTFCQMEGGSTSIEAVIQPDFFLLLSAMGKTMRFCSGECSCIPSVSTIYLLHWGASDQIPRWIAACVITVQLCPVLTYTLGDPLVFVPYLTLLRVCDGSVPATDFFAFGSNHPLHAARTHQRSHPDKIIVRLSTTRTSSTQCEAAKPPKIDKASNTRRHSCGCHYTITAKPARFGSAGACLCAFLKSLGNFDNDDVGTHSCTMRH